MAVNALVVYIARSSAEKFGKAKKSTGFMKSSCQQSFFLDANISKDYCKFVPLLNNRAFEWLISRVFAEVFIILSTSDFSTYLNSIM